MATSGSYTLTQTRSQIIQAAARKVGAIESGETMSADMTSDFAGALNAMLKYWQAIGVEIWTTAEGILFLQTDQTQYTLSSSSSDHATESYVQTTLSADVANGASTITVASITGISSGDYIGVQQDDGALDWTTVNGAPSGSSITLTAAMGDSASSGNLVVAYTTKLVRPLRLISARRYNFDSAIDTPLRIYDRMEYRETPNKTVESTPNAVFYDRRGGANSSGLLHVWPEPSTVDEAIKFTFARPIQVFSTSADEPDFPEEWIEPVQYNLALRLADEFDVPVEKYNRLEKRATETLARVTWNETELTDIQFIPEYR